MPLSDEQRRAVAGINAHLARVDHAVLAAEPPAHAQPPAPDDADGSGGGGGSDGGGGSGRTALPARLVLADPVHGGSDLHAALLAGA